MATATYSMGVCPCLARFAMSTVSLKNLPMLRLPILLSLPTTTRAMCWNSSGLTRARCATRFPKIIASFANSRGGWLIIGVADDDHSVCPVPRGNADYSQIIGELCRRHVSPAPPFDVRFIADPANDAQGVGRDTRGGGGAFHLMWPMAWSRCGKGQPRGPATGAGVG